jgi:hypothetical protein
MDNGQEEADSLGERVCFFFFWARKNIERSDWNCLYKSNVFMKKKGKTMGFGY